MTDLVRGGAMMASGQRKGSARRLREALHFSTTLTVVALGGIVATIGAGTPTFAQSFGGAGGTHTGTAGGAGGGFGLSGEDGTIANGGAGGGGGAGAQGGSSLSGYVGGAAGVDGNQTDGSAGGNGNSGVGNDFSGDGGGGGGNGFVTAGGAASLTNGFRGGDGGRGGYGHGGGSGGGGSGGYGIVANSSGVQLHIDLGAAMIVGGNGGVGGTVVANLGDVLTAGDGGDGGVGIHASASGSNLAVLSGSIAGGDGAQGGGWGVAIPPSQVSGGRGGQGGAATVLQSGVITNDGTLRGGNGGDGGQGYYMSSGDAGAGGTGVVASASTIRNSGTISGGAGGQGGTDSLDTERGATGAGGAGIAGSSLIIVNFGTISGGFSGDGVTRASAITFTGGMNALTFGNATSGLLGNIAIGGGGSLDLNQNNGVDTVIGNTITGTGSVRKSGANAVTLSGANSYTGSTTVEDGILEIAAGGSIVSDTMVNGGAFVVNGIAAGVTVGSGGLFGGSGTVGSTLIASGGTLAPGNSIGTLTIDGDLTFAAGAFFTVEVDPAGTASDKVMVTGTATLGGSVMHLGAGGTYKPFSSYRILSAERGLDGEFGSVKSDFAFLTPKLSYDYEAYTVDLTLVRNDIDFAAMARSRNQKAVAGGVESLVQGGVLYDAVAGLPDNAGLIQASFDQLSGELQATARGVLLADSRFVRDAIGQRIGAAFGGVGAFALPVMAYGDDSLEFVPATTERFAFWSQAFGSWGTEQGDGNAAGVSRSIGGFLIGGDAAVNDTWRLGLLTGYSHDRFDSDGRAASGSSDNYHLGLYGGGQWDAFSLRGGAAYSFSRIDTARAVAFPGFVDRLSAQYDAGTAQVFGEAAYRVDTAAASFEPFANLAYVSVHSDGFAEDGGPAALRADGSTSNAAFATLGVRGEADVALGDVSATARGLVGWRHAFGDVTPEATLAFAGGEAFTVAGAPIARDAAVLEAGLDFRLTPAATLGLAYSGQLASRARDNGFKVDLSVRF